MKSNFLLKTKEAERLYLEYAKSLPIIDFHNHLSVSDIACDKRFEDLYELWLACDPYKHRLMRICGIDEHFITGDAAPYEKFERFCEIFPLLAGNPVYDWARMELSQIFGIDTILTRDNARYVYDKCGEMLASREFSNNAILALVLFAEVPLTRVATDFPDTDWRDAELEAAVLPTELLLPTPPRVETLLVKTLSEPVLYLDPCQRSSLSPTM